MSPEHPSPAPVLPPFPWAPSHPHPTLSCMQYDPTPPSEIYLPCQWKSPHPGYSRSCPPLPGILHSPWSAWRPPPVRRTERIFPGEYH